MFISQFREVLQEFRGYRNFADIFGGSGLLSQNIVDTIPCKKVIYNDFDYFIDRIKHLDETIKLGKILKDKLMLKGWDGQTEATRNMQMAEKDWILPLLREWEEKHGYLDMVTISSFLCFGGKSYDWRMMEECVFYFNFPKEIKYNADGYLQNPKIEITHDDYRDLLKRVYAFDDNEKEKYVIVADPPYLNSLTKSYRGNFKKNDFTELLGNMRKPFIFFSTAKSGFLELLDDYPEFKGYKYLTAHTSLNCDVDDDMILWNL